jgi:excisionase family DNA binding protein
MITSTSIAPPYPEDRLLRVVPDVANLTGFSRAKLYRLMRSGELPTVRIGGSVRIRYQSLLAWMKANESAVRKDALGSRKLPTDSMRT